MALPRVVLVAAILALTTGAASAGGVLDRVRAQARIRCGAVERPGLLDVTPGRASGVFVDLCHAIGAAVVGSGVQVEVRAYDSDKAFDAVREGTDDVFFLSGAEIVGQGLAGKVLPGPPAYVAATAVMVPASSMVRDLADLAGQPICFEQGSDAHRDLEAWFAAHRLDVVRMGYQEYDEMTDAYDAQACHALAGEATGLAALLRGSAMRRGRLLPTPLDTIPILAATGLDDARWSAVVAWSIDTLMVAGRPTTEWRGAGAAALPLTDVAGLPSDWQSRMLAASGSYAAILARNVGRASPLNVEAVQTGAQEPTLADN